MDYAVSYISAARSVVNDATARGVLDQMAAPCLYLQRHATELLLKKLLDAIYNIQSMEMTLKTGVHSPPRVTPTTHDLVQLVGHATKALATRKLTLPASLASLAGEIRSFEDGDATRTRYDRGAKGKSYERKSFPDEVLVPVLDWQKLLEGVLVEHFVIHENFRDQASRTMAEVLFELSEAVSDALRRSGLEVETPFVFEWGTWLSVREKPGGT